MSNSITEASRFTREIRTDFYTRKDGDEHIIEGYFSVFNSPYEVWDDMTEEVMPGAFEETLRKDDIRALVNHDTTLVLGRNKAGTLSLEEREKGLFGSIRINPKDQDAMNILARVERGDVTQCSFGFDVLDYETERKDDHVNIYLKRVKLYEVSVCTFPAYKETEVSARNAGFAKDRRTEVMRMVHNAWKEEILKKFRKE